jgi:hypothetical protein
MVAQICNSSLQEAAVGGSKAEASPRQKWENLPENYLKETMVRITVVVGSAPT